MHLAARNILLALSLMAEVISVPRKENRFGEPEAPASREPQNPEEEEMVGFGGPWVGDALSGVNHGDGHGRSPPPESSEGGEVKPLSLEPPPRFPSWPQRIPEEPVCQVKLEKGDSLSPHLLEVTGLLRSYDSGFLKAMSRSPWGVGDLETFGVCATDPPLSLLSSLRRVWGALNEPGEHRVLLLHLEEVKWEEEATKLRFKLAFHKEKDKTLGFSHLALLVFYRGDEAPGTSEPWKKFLVGGEGLPQAQVGEDPGVLKWVSFFGHLAKAPAVASALLLRVLMDDSHNNPVR